MSDKYLLNDSIDFNPRIYAYRDNNPEYIGILKIGYTTQEVSERINNNIQLYDLAKVHMKFY